MAREDAKDESGGADPSPFGECHPDVPPPLDAPMGIVSRMLTLGVVSAFSKFVVSVMNRATCSNYDTLLRHMTERERPRGLITVSNHASTFDDPGVLSYLIPARYFATEPSHGGVRWTICTAEICAASPLVHMFFAAGKTVPINRGVVWTRRCCGRWRSASARATGCTSSRRGR